MEQVSTRDVVGHAAGAVLDPHVDDRLGIDSPGGRRGNRRAELDMGLTGRGALDLLVDLVLDLEDEITKGALMAHGGKVVHPAVLETLGAGQGGGTA